MDLQELFENTNWETAIIIFKESNWDKKYSEKDRSYRVSRDNKYFDSEMCGNSLFGNCLDEKDFGVRLDLYGWEVEKVVIEN